jgi:uncharacterized protein
MIAREKGLEPLAERVWRNGRSVDPAREARRYVTPASSTVAEELKVPGRGGRAAGGAGRHRRARERRRRRPGRENPRAVPDARHDPLGGVAARSRRGRSSRTTSTGPSRWRRAPVAPRAGHRRGGGRGVPRLQIRRTRTRPSPSSNGSSSAARHARSEQVRLAVRTLQAAAVAVDGDRGPARVEARADAAAIDVFAANLRHCCSPPARARSACWRSTPASAPGCKTVVLDAQGRLLHNDVIYPDQGQQQARARPRRRSSTSSIAHESRRSPSATARPRARPSVRPQLGLPRVDPSRDGQRVGRVDLLRSEAAREEFP